MSPTANGIRDHRASDCSPNRQRSDQGGGAERNLQVRVRLAISSHLGNHIPGMAASRSQVTQQD
jgi:hypothetical protein